MKYKPFLLHNKDKGSFTLIHIDTDTVKKIEPTYDSMQRVNITKHSPLKKIHIGHKLSYD